MGIEQIFLKILNMSLSASLVACIVIVLHFCLRMAPKKYSYILWIIVFIRFLTPFTIESIFSLMPLNPDIITYDKIVTTKPINLDSSKLDTVDTKINSLVMFQSLGKVNGIKSTIPMQDYILMSAVIWIVFALLLLVLSIFNLVKLKSKLRTATLVSKPHDRIFETDQIKSPFLIGIISPRIYLPIGLTNDEKYHVICHERMHQKRKDNLLKPLAFFAVILHWFNPLAWLSFYLFTKDMEMSCDELVMEQAVQDIRLDYSKSLLSLSIKQSCLLTPLAFGESNTKSRIKNIIKFKKPSRRVSVIAIFVLLITAITLLTNSKTSNEFESFGNNIKQKALTNSELADELYKNRTPYIGDNSKVAALIYALPVPEGLSYKSLELQTSKEPYELHVYYEYDINSEIEPNDTTIDENADIGFRNFAYLFATIENMEKCTFHIEIPTGESNYTYTRKEIEAQLGVQLYAYSKKSDDLELLIEKVNDYIKQLQDSVETEP